MSSYGKDLSVGKLNGWYPFLNETYKTLSITGADGATPTATIPAGSVQTPMEKNWYINLQPNATPIASQDLTITLPAGFTIEDYVVQVHHNQEGLNTTGILTEYGIGSGSPNNTIRIRRSATTGTLGVQSYFYMRIIPLSPY